MNQAPMRSHSWPLLLLLWAVLLLLALVRPLALPDEGRYGEIGRWMLVSGDWLTPRLNGVPFFHKPPYLYWLEASALAAFGVHAWTVRLIPALHAGLMLLALYLGARLMGGERLARRAALMLGTSLSFLIGGQYVNHDMLVACWIGIAIWAFAAAFMHGERPHTGLALLGFAACALGVLSKGLIGLALPGLVLLIWIGWTRQWVKILRLPWWRGLALFALLAVPWFVLSQREFPAMFSYMFGTHQFGRYTGTTFNNARPWWFYLACLVLLMFPWVLFIRPGRQMPSASSTVAPHWLALLWIWLVAIVGFFSIPNSKLVGYVLPVMPPLALLCALGFGRWMDHRPEVGRRWLLSLAGLMLLVALGVSVVAGRYSQQRGTRDVAQALACQASVTDTVYAIGDFPYDLPFYSGMTRPLVVVQDWDTLRRTAGDNWRRELFEGADFDARAAAVLQPPAVLETARSQPGGWLVLPRSTSAAERPTGWTPVAEGKAWLLWKSTPLASAGSAGKGPEAAQHKGLPGCKDQGHEQRQH